MAYTPEKTIYLYPAHVSEEGIEQKYIKETFDANWVVPLSPDVNGFGKGLGFSTGENKRVVTLSAGTAAIYLALLACGVKPGGEVLVQSFIFCASSYPIAYLGVMPVSVDSEADTWGMDPVLLEEAIQDRVEKTGETPKTIVAVALYGMPYKVDGIIVVADRYGVLIIEDAAEGFDSRYDGHMLGTFGRYGMLSFDENKMTTTSDEGALTCPDEATKQETMLYATQAQEAYSYYQHERIRYNYRMSNIYVDIGRGQMMVAGAHVTHHKHACNLYRELLGDVKGITLHENPSGRFDSNYWLNTIVLDPLLGVRGQEDAYQATVQGAAGGAGGMTHTAANARTDCKLNANVEAMRVRLDAMGIESRPLWKPMHKQPVYKNYPAYVNGVGESLFKVGLCLPSGPYVTDGDAAYVVDCIKRNIS